MAFLDENGLQILWTKIKSLFVTVDSTRDGLMTSEEHTKLKGIAEGANKYTLPTATKTVLGGVKTGSDVTSTTGLTAAPIISGIPYYKDTTYGDASANSRGLMTAAMFNKLDNIEAEAQVNTVDSVNGKTGAVVLSKSDVGLGNVTNESKATMFASPVFTGTPTAPTPSAATNNTQIATTAFVQTLVSSKVAAAEAMRYKGTIGTSGTVTSLPATHTVGDTYKVITASTYAGKKCEVGDMLICNTSGTVATDSHWDVVQANIDGAVTLTGNQSSVTANTVPVFEGATGKVIKSSGYTIGKSVPSDAKFTDTTYGLATASANGLMSKTTFSALNENKAVTLLNDVDADVTVDDTSVNVHWDVLADTINYITGELSSNSNLGYVDFTLEAATTSKAGLMSAADKAKLVSISDDVINALS